MTMNSAEAVPPEMPAGTAAAAASDAAYTVLSAQVDAIVQRQRPIYTDTFRCWILIDGHVFALESEAPELESLHYNHF